MTTVHLHLILTHIPVIGSLFVLALLAIALVRREGMIGKIAFWLAAGLGVAAIAVYFTGEGAEEAVEHLPGITENLIEQHEEIALVATVMIAAFGVLALAALLMLRHRAMPRWVVLSGFAGMIAIAGVMAWTANLGGQIRHTEIRTEAKRAEAGSAQEDHE